MALEDRPIRVNAVSPDPIDTPAVSRVLKTPQEVEQFETNMVAAVPLGRIGYADEIAKAVAFSGPMGLDVGDSNHGQNPGSFSPGPGRVGEIAGHEEALHNVQGWQSESQVAIGQLAGDIRPLWHAQND